MTREFYGNMRARESEEARRDGGLFLSKTASAPAWTVVVLLELCALESSHHRHIYMPARAYSVLARLASPPSSSP